MRFLASSRYCFLQGAVNNAMLLYLICIYPVFAQNEEIGTEVHQEVEPSIATSKKLSYENPCFICNKEKEDINGKSSTFFLNVHGSTDMNSQTRTHRAHISCLLVSMATSPKKPERGEPLDLECKLCDNRFSKDLIIDAICDNLRKHDVRGNPGKKNNKVFNRYAESTIPWLHVIYKHPVLLEFIRNSDIKFYARKLGFLLSYRTVNKEMKSYFSKFVKKHNTILFIHPRNIIIEDPEDDTLNENISARTLDMATPGEISKIFVNTKDLSSKGSKILAHFLLHAIQPSSLREENNISACLDGPILCYLDLLSGEKLISFCRSGVISGVHLWRQYIKEFTPLFKKANCFPTIQRGEKMTLRKMSLKKKEILYIKLIIPMVICRAYILTRIFGNDMTYHEKRLLFILAVKELKKKAGFILKNGLAEDIFRQYLSIPWLRIIYKRDNDLEGEELNARNLLIKTSDKFLAKLAPSVSNRDVIEEMRKSILSYIEDHSVPFLEERISL